MKISNNKYPIFSGNVLSVSGVIEMDGETYSIIDYITVKDGEEVDKSRDLGAAFVALFSESKMNKLEEKLKEKISRVVVPLRIDPEVLRGANVRARFGKVAGRRTYEVEVICGRSSNNQDPFMAMAEVVGKTPYTGFKYLKFIDEEESS